MIILFKIEGNKVEATINGFTTEHKRNFLDKLTFNDVRLYIQSENNKQRKNQ